MLRIFLHFVGPNAFSDGRTNWLSKHQSQQDTRVRGVYQFFSVRVACVCGSRGMASTWPRRELSRVAKLGKPRYSGRGADVWSAAGKAHQNMTHDLR